MKAAGVGDMAETELEGLGAAAPAWLCGNPPPYHSWAHCPRCLRRRAALFDKRERTTAVAEFTFDDVTRKEAPVRVGKKQYVLLEATGDAAFRWRNACAKAAKMTGGKVVGVGDIADTEALLVSLCLYEVDEQGRWRAMPDGSPDPHYQVGVQVIRAWPYRCIKPLFDWVRQNSALEERETRETLLEKRRDLEEQLEAFSGGEDPLKNSSPAPAVGSA